MPSPSTKWQPGRASHQSATTSLRHRTNQAGFDSVALVTEKVPGQQED